MYDVIVASYDWFLGFLEFAGNFLSVLSMPLADFIFRYAPTSNALNLIYVAVLTRLGIAQYSLISILFGVGLLAVIVVSVIKWCIGIIT